MKRTVLFVAAVMVFFLWSQSSRPVGSAPTRKPAAPIDMFRGRSQSSRFSTAVLEEIDSPASTNLNMRQILLDTSINVPAGPPTSVSISGQPKGTTENSYSFTAAVSPNNAKLPIDYIWQATDQHDRTAPDVFALSHTIMYSWTEPGIKIITATAWNESGSARNYHTIDIEAPVKKVAIYGPTAGITNSMHAFAASVEPLNASPPITFTWSPTPTTGQGTAGTTYIWQQSGTKIISVAVTNGSGTITVTDSYTITVGPIAEPVRDVNISSPPIGFLNVVYNFTATVNPITATQPITYVWNATDQNDNTTVVNSSSHAIPLVWSVPGTKTITVTASNTSSVLTTTMIAITTAQQSKVYLPATSRRWPPWEVEPNNKPFGQTDGPLISSVGFYGFPNDAWDCFIIDMDRAGWIVVDLSQHTGQGIQLLLYYQTQHNLKVQVHSKPYHFEYYGPAGLYSTCIYTASGFNVNSPYVLFATFP